MLVVYYILCRTENGTWNLKWIPCKLNFVLLFFLDQAHKYGRLKII